MPITGLQSRTPKLVPHDTGRAGRDDAVRCQGSNRQLTLNVTIRTWETRLTDGNAETAHRRSDRVVRKPQTRPARAVMQITDVVIDDRKARQLEEAHLKGCTTCSPVPREDALPVASRCADGRRLAQLAAHAKRVAPARRERQMQEEDLADKAAQARRRLRRTSWESTDRDVRETDARRSWRPAGDEPLGAPPVPLKRLRPERPSR